MFDEENLISSFCLSVNNTYTFNRNYEPANMFNLVWIVIKQGELKILFWFLP